MIATLSKAKLPQALSYPIADPAAAAAISEVLA
jgi:hypothetical protein